MLTEIIFDIETKKFFDEVEGRDPGKLGVSVVSAYKRRLGDTNQEIEGEMRSFWEKDFEEMWKWFAEADRVIGFNSLGFDVPVLSSINPDFPRLFHCDLLVRVKEAYGRRVSLDSIAKETLGVSKLASGADAVTWWAAGDEKSLNNLRKYCEMDVTVTRDVYDYGIKYGKIKFKDRWNEIREIGIDFSFPVKAVSEKEDEQMGLF